MDPVLEREGVAPALCDCCTLHTPLCAGIALVFAGQELSVQESRSKIVGSCELAEKVLYEYDLVRVCTGR